MQWFDKINTAFKRELDKEAPLYNCIIPEQLTCPEFELLRKYNVPWEATEKIDGECTSIHLIPVPMASENGGYVYTHRVEVHGKTDKANMRPEEVELLSNLGQKQALLDTFTDADGNPPTSEIIIFGETYGKGMQAPGGRYCKTHLKFICFDIKIGNTWLTRESVEDICKRLGIDTVPYLGEMTLDEAIERVKAGFTSQVSEDPTLPAEGIVLRAPLGILDRRGRRIITKVKTCDFRKLEEKLSCQK